MTYATPNEYGVFDDDSDVVKIPLPKKIKGEIRFGLHECADGWRWDSVFQARNGLTVKSAVVADRAWPSRRHALGAAWADALNRAPAAYFASLDRVRNALGSDGPIYEEGGMPSALFTRPAKSEAGGLFRAADCERDELTPGPSDQTFGCSRLDVILLVQADDGWRWALTATAAGGTESSRPSIKDPPCETRHEALIRALERAVDWFGANTTPERAAEVVAACRERAAAIRTLHGMVEAAQPPEPESPSTPEPEPAPAPRTGGTVVHLTAITMSEVLREHLTLRGVVTVNRLRDVVARTSLDELLRGLRGNAKNLAKYHEQIERAIADLPANALDDLPGLGLSPGVCGSLATLYEIVQLDDLTQWAFDDAEVIKTFLDGLREDDRLLIVRTLRLEGVEWSGSVPDFAKPQKPATPAPEPEPVPVPALPPAAAHGPDPLIADYYRAMRDAAAREVKAEARVAELVADLREARAELKAAVAETRRLNRGGTAALCEQRTLSFEGAA